MLLAALGSELPQSEREHWIYEPTFEDGARCPASVPRSDVAYTGLGCSRLHPLRRLSAELAVECGQSINDRCARELRARNISPTRAE